MRRLTLGIALALLGLVACLSESSPTPPSTGDLDGSWGWSENRNPGGASINLTLTTSGSKISGRGEICTVGTCDPGPVTVTGNHTVAFSPFTITLTGPHHYRRTYTGQFLRPDQLQGTWSANGQTATYTFNRCGSTFIC